MSSDQVQILSSRVTFGDVDARVSVPDGIDIAALVTAGHVAIVDDDEQEQDDEGSDAELLEPDLDLSLPELDDEDDDEDGD